MLERHKIGCLIFFVVVVIGLFVDVDGKELKDRNARKMLFQPKCHPLVLCSALYQDFSILMFFFVLSSSKSEVIMFIIIIILNYYYLKCVLYLYQWIINIQYIYFNICLSACIFKQS